MLKEQEINLVELIERYRSEDSCRARLEELRWPDGVECPRCESRNVASVEDRHQYQCRSCRYQFSVTAGTIFHDSHLPLWKWFLAVYLIVEFKKGISANQLKRTLGVSYKTAWYLCHRIRAALNEVDAQLLKGIVEVDETFVGGEMHGKGRGYKGNKVTVVGAIQRSGNICLQVVSGTDRETLHGFIRENVAEDTEAIYTDEWSLLKRSIIGSYHQVSAKHLDAYLDELEFRFNNRENPYMFRDAMLKLLLAGTLPYKKLIAEQRQLTDD